MYHNSHFQSLIIRKDTHTYTHRHVFGEKSALMAEMLELWTWFSHGLKNRWFLYHVAWVNQHKYTHVHTRTSHSRIISPVNTTRFIVSVVEMAGGRSAGKPQLFTCTSCPVTRLETFLEVLLKAKPGLKILFLTGVNTEDGLLRGRLSCFDWVKTWFNYLI